MINYLEEKHIEEIAKCLKIWQNKNEKDTIKELKESLHSKDYPITITLTKNNNLIGFYQIVKYDLENTNLTPWLANVYIKEEYRGNGYSKILLGSIPKILNDLKINKLYLHSRLTNFYEKMGWKILEELHLPDNIKRNIYIYDKSQSND